MFSGNSSGQVSFRIQINATAVPNGSGGYYFYSNAGSSAAVMQGGTVLTMFNGNSSYPVDTYVTLTLTAGTQYKLITSAIGGVTSQPSGTLPQAHISTVFYVNNSAFTPKKVAFSGLRVKSIKNYDSNGSVFSTETYKYGTGESGLGICLTNPSLMVNVSTHLFAFDPNSHQPPIATETTYSNSSVYALSSLNGSPMAYPSVTVYHGDTVNNIGKSIYNYIITPDSLSIWNQNLVPVGTLTDSIGANGNYVRCYYCNTTNTFTRQGLRPVSRLWQNGEPVSELDYLRGSNGQYMLQRLKQTTYKNFFRSGPAATFISFGIVFSGIPENYSTGYFSVNNFTIFDYTASAGSRLPISTTTFNYAPDGVTPLTVDTVKYFYDNQAHMYPTRIRSYDGKGDSLLKTVKYPQDMVNAGLDPTGIYAAMSAANIISPVIQFTQSKNATQMEQSVTNYASTNGIINPSTVSLQVMANPAETRLNYQKYDPVNGNLLTVSKQGGPPVSYIWGYHGEYPVAEVKNAAANDIFYESFEDGNGNSTSGDAKSGYYSHTGSYSKSLMGLDNGNYVLSYWQKAGSAWGLVTTPVTVTSGAYAINLSTQVDDIRFYPVNALMTTYTYVPTVGVSSVTDVKNETTFYEYDQFERLLNIKDVNGNIVKSFCYNYAGQTTSCNINPLVPPVATIPTYAFTLTNSTGVSGFVASFSGGIGNLNFPNSGSAVFQIPAGTYTVTINPINAPTNRKFLLGGRAPVIAPGTTFTNVIVSAAYSESPLIIQNP